MSQHNSTFALVAFPNIVQHYAPPFESAFSSRAFVEFKRYISRLIVSEIKTMDGLNNKPKGVLSVDDTLLVHYGKDFE